MAGRFVGVALILAAVIPLGAGAEAPAAFVRLRDRAHPVDSLAAFLERYVGSCTDPFEKAACEANARRSRAELTGKVYYVALDDSAARMLKPGRYDSATREYQIELMPFFEAGGLALTDGTPKSQDAQGRPRMQLTPLTVNLPPDWLPMDMERLLRTQNVRIHLVFKPLGLWALPARGGGGKLEGVTAKFLAVRLTHVRTGEEIALRVAGE